MLFKPKQDPSQQQIDDLITEVEAIKRIVVRIETRLCKLMMHEGAQKLIYKQQENQQ